MKDEDINRIDWNNLVMPNVGEVYCIIDGDHAGSLVLITDIVTRYNSCEEDIYLAKIIFDKGFKSYAIKENDMVCLINDRKWIKAGDMNSNMR